MFLVNLFTILPDLHSVRNSFLWSQTCAPLSRLRSTHHAQPCSLPRGLQFPQQGEHRSLQRDRRSFPRIFFQRLFRGVPSGCGGSRPGGRSSFALKRIKTQFIMCIRWHFTVAIMDNTTVSIKAMMSFLSPGKTWPARCVSTVRTQYTNVHLVAIYN